MSFFYSIKEYYKLILVVFLAFFIMVASSYMFAKRIVENKNADISRRVISNAENAIRAYFSDSQAILLNVVFGVEEALARGATDKELQTMIVKWNWWLKGRKDISFFNGIFGKVHGVYLDSSSWEPHNEFTPEIRPWYRGALNSSKLYFSSPYTNALTGNFVTSISTSVQHNGEYCGVLAVDVLVNKITQYVEDMKLAGNGHGLLLDSNFQIIVHPKQALIGKNIHNVNPEFHNISKLLAAGKEVSAAEIITSSGNDSIAFFRPLYNGWYLGVVTDKDAYNKDIYSVAVGLGIIGFFMMAILSGLLIQMEKARKRSAEESQSKSNFLATMSHEIRTPMNAIIGMSEMVLREDITPVVREHMMGVKHAGEYLLSLINDILDFSKIESGKIEIIESIYFFPSTINDIIDMIRMKVAEKPINFVAYVASDIPNELIGDEPRVRQIMLNVLNNAVKYTQEGFISFSVDIEIADYMAYLKIDVADSGIGIKEEDQIRLFGDFVRIDNEKTRGVEGTGLGLAITHNLCKAMGGSIFLKSEYGRGSMFSIIIPQKIASKKTIAKVDHADDHRVLLYGPNNIFAVSIRRTLRDLGVKYRLVSNQGRLKDSLLSGKYDFVFVYSLVLESVKNIIQKSDVNITLVVVADLGEPLVGHDFKVLTLPGYSIPIANILNGVDGFETNQHQPLKYFTAPNARILLVDDIKTNIVVARGLLAPYNMQIDAVESGEAAIDKVKKEKYDIVFMDHMMPVMDGLEATRKIRALEDPGGYYAKLPIIALSANAASGAKDMFLQSGMDDFIYKPIDVNMLNSILEKWIPSDKKQQYVDNAGDKSLTALNIEGIDVARGLQMTGGSLDGYFNILNVFLRDGTKQIACLEEFYLSKNLSMYANSVHAMKSACASIGGIKISEMAKNLEYAAKNENMVFIGKHHDDFIKNLSVLLNNISAVLLTNFDILESNEITEDVAGKYKKLLECIDKMDMTGIDNILSELKVISKASKNRDFIDGLTENILLSDFDEAIYKIKFVLKDYKKGT